MGTDSSFVAYDKPWANASNTPFRLFKKWGHEGGIATPLIVQWPEHDINRGEFTDQVGHVIDLMPTFLEISGAEYPETDSLLPLQGKSLVPALLGDEFDREPLFWEHEAKRAVRDGKWKLVSEGTNNPPYTSEWELYNLEDDRSETNNLIDKYPEKAERLEKLWEEWAKDNNVYPLDGRGWFDRLK
jgi:arylsulfatase